MSSKSSRLVLSFLFDFGSAIIWGLFPEVALIFVIYLLPSAFCFATRMSKPPNFFSTGSGVTILTCYFFFASRSSFSSRSICARKSVTCFACSSLSSESSRMSSELDVLWTTCCWFGVSYVCDCSIDFWPAILFVASLSYTCWLAAGKSSSSSITGGCSLR